MFSEYHLACEGFSLRRDREPEVCLRTGHHKLQIIGRLASGLGSCSGYTGDAAVLNATSAALFVFICGFKSKSRVLVPR